MSRRLRQENDLSWLYWNPDAQKWWSAKSKKFINNVAPPSTIESITPRNTRENAIREWSEGSLGTRKWQNRYAELQNIERKRVTAEKKRLMHEGEKIKKARNEERKRFAAVKQGNLLGLSAPAEPNLLTFGATKEGLAKRENELRNLFGGRKTRKARKARKTRKQNRK